MTRESSHSRAEFARAICYLTEQALIASLYTQCALQTDEKTGQPKPKAKSLTEAPGAEKAANSRQASHWLQDIRLFKPAQS